MNQAVEGDLIDTCSGYRQTSETLKSETMSSKPTNSETLDSETVADSKQQNFETY